MQFAESVDRSAELLRQALPWMSKQKAALHPISYAVWYAYVSGALPALKQDADQLIAQHGALDEAMTQQLYERHVSGFDAAVAQRVSEELNRVLGDMSGYSREAREQTADYGAKLQRAVAQPPLREQIEGTIESLLESTRQMQQHMGTLQQRVTESQGEIERLRDEVRRAREASHVDPLTKLANRGAFDERLAELLPASRAGAPRAALLMMDIDHFKRINDGYGHAFGDQVLKAIAQVLQRVVPPEAQVARYGGEEFAVVLPDTATIEAARALAERIRNAVAAARIRRKTEDSGERVTISIGVALHSPAESALDFIDRADKALYRAKADGRDRVEVDPR